MDKEVHLGERRADDRFVHFIDWSKSKEVVSAAETIAMIDSLMRDRR